MEVKILMITSLAGKVEAEQSSPNSNYLSFVGARNIQGLQSVKVASLTLASSTGQLGLPADLSKPTIVDEDDFRRTQNVVSSKEVAEHLFRRTDLASYTQGREILLSVCARVCAYVWTRTSLFRLS